MSIVVFWVDPVDGAKAQGFTDKELNEALKYCEALRQGKFRHVTISSEMSDSVGLPGVNTVKDGKTPDGHDYEWSKQHRGAGPASMERK